jgi:hypothetical protein
MTSRIAGLFLKRTPWNFPLLAVPYEKCPKICESLSNILRMILMLIFGAIVNQAKK